MNFDFTQDFGSTSTGEFEPIPIGDYIAKVAKAEWKMSKAGQEYLSLGFQLQGNENYNNRYVFETYNIFHSNEKVKNISMAKFQKLLLSVKASNEAMKNLDKTSMIEIVANKTVMLTLGIKKDIQYGDKNIIKKVSETRNVESKKAIDLSEIPF